MGNACLKLVLRFLIGAVLVWAACAKNKSENESTTQAQTTMPTLNLSCGSGSCL